MSDQEPALPRRRRASTPSHLAFPIVGLGASAGGLRALSTLLDGLPADSGMAFVVILHLSPRYASNADKVLQRSTRMPVEQVTGTRAIEPNRVYVISPNSELTMSDGYLRVDPEDRPRGRHVAIDLFFRALAEVHREHSIGVVLSGSGTDGTVGLASIREQGGVCIAQAPADAEYEDMPRSAIERGIVDFVLPAAEIPEQLLALRDTSRRITLPPSASPDAPDPARDGQPSTDGEAALAAVLRLLAERTGHDFRHYKRATVLRRIERRMQVNGVLDLPAYVAFLEQKPAETAALLDDMLISVTNFFRDREAFEALEREVVPALFRGRGPQDAVRAWVAGCATGEEAYSVAMLLCDEATGIPQPPSVQVFATDIDERALAIARSGTYPGSIVTDVPPSRLRTFFEAQGERYRIRKGTRDRVMFAVHNVLRDPPFSQLDLVCCRNLLIYLDRDIQARLLEAFHFALRPGGYLFLGNSESPDLSSHHFEVVDKKARIMRARPALRAPRRVPELPLRPLRPPPQLSAGGRDTQGRAAPTEDDLHRRALAQFAQPSVLADSDGNIVHISERAGHFLRFGAGAPSRALVDTVHPELRLELRTALFQATHSGKSVEARRVRIGRDDGESFVNMVVRPFRDTDAGGEYVLVLFDEVEDTLGADIPLGHSDDPVLLKLEEELRHTRERLQSTMEQSDASAEELKASNEELQAINEELRSATEELETSKEELQSLNEELITVNSELKLKVEETSQVNDDLQNFISSTEIATVFVDRGLRIKRCTPRAGSIFNIIPGDVGRPLLDITHRLDYPELAEDAARVFDTLQPSEREVHSLDGRRYLARILPYRTGEHRIDGAVLTFVDVTSLRAAEQLAQAHDRGGGEADDGTGEARTAERLQRATALRASALRDEFLSVMSHELKQPLNLIAVNAQVLSRLPELRASPVASRAVQTIHASVRGQSRIIEDLLDLSRMRTGKLELVRQPLDMAALVQAAAEMAAADASAGAIDVALEVPDSPVLVSADPVRLEQVIWNLLGNAVKFTPPGGRVTLALAVEGAHARLDVRDTGRGIAPAFLSRIFDMFDQGDGQDGRNRGGLGIGLALVRQLVELHGGRVAAHSGGPGHGTCMSVWLPLLEETPPAVTVDTSKLPAGVLTGLRILLVDDNPETVESLAMLLALEQAETLTATDGGTALRLAGERSGALDLLLTDIGMPGMDGYALAEAIHVLPGLQDLPVIALTGFGRSEGAGEAQRSGIAAQLVKPVTLDALVAAIDRVLGRPGSGA